MGSMFGGGRTRVHPSDPRVNFTCRVVDGDDDDDKDDDDVYGDDDAKDDADDEDKGDDEDNGDKRR
jgi:hypothetical protein